MLALDDPLELRDRRSGALFRRQGNRGRLGFITPLTHNFCENCNRVRVTCTGTLYMCLGQEDAADLREPLRRSARTRRLFGDPGGDRPQAEGP